MKFNQEMAVGFMIGWLATLFLWPPIYFWVYLLKVDFGLFFAILWGFIGGKIAK